MNCLNFPNRIRMNVQKLSAVLLVFAFTAPAVAQEEADNPFGGEQQQKMMETQFFMQQLMMLGHNEELRKELEVVDDQVEDVKDLAQNYQKDMMKFYSENRELMEEMQQLYRDGNTEEGLEMGKEFQKKNAEFSQSYMDKAAAVLLPHQIDRLKQIAKQQVVKMTNKYSDEFGMASSMAKELGLSPEETRKLNETIKAARDEYYAAVETAKKKANEKIMSVLTIKQQEKMKEILGDMWDQDATLRKTREQALKRQKDAMKKRRKE